jgi:hypothetical protein
MDGTGIISAGLLDVNIAQADGSSAPYSEVPFTGIYRMLTSSSGTAQFTFTSLPPWAAIANPLPTVTMNFAFALSLDGTFADLTETDTGFAGSGDFTVQDPNPTTDFSTAKIKGGYVFEISGPGGKGGSAVQHGLVGRLHLTAGNATAGVIDDTNVTSVADDETGTNPQQGVSGTYFINDPANGHGGINLVTAAFQIQVAAVSFYVASPGTLYALKTDPNPASNTPGGILLGVVRAMGGGVHGIPFTNASLNGPSILQLLGITPSTVANGQGHSSVAIGILSATAGAMGAGTLTGEFDANDGGTMLPGAPVSLSGATFTIVSDGFGRGTISIPLTVNGTSVTYNFVFYLQAQSVGLGSQSNGFLLEQPASDRSNRGRSGNWVPQIVSPPIQASGLGAATFIVGGGTGTAGSVNALDVFTVDGNAGTYGSLINGSGGMGTFAIPDATNGRGTLTPTNGTKLFANGSAAFYVTAPDSVIAIGTDASVLDPQIIFLNQ